MFSNQAVLAAVWSSIASVMTSQTVYFLLELSALYFRAFVFMIQSTYSTPNKESKSFSYKIWISSVQLFNRVRLFKTPSIRVFSNESTLHMRWQSTGVSALASVLPKKSQGWSPSEWTGWISLQSKGLSRVFSNTTVQKHQFFSAQPSSQSNSHIHTWPQEKP